MANQTKLSLVLAILCAPSIAMAHGGGGGGIGGGVGGGIGGGMGGPPIGAGSIGGGASNGIGNGVGNSSNAGSGANASGQATTAIDTSGLEPGSVRWNIAQAKLERQQRAEERRLAAAKAATNSNTHTAFGQTTAATAQTLGTDPAARATFGADTSAAAKLQGQANGSAMGAKGVTMTVASTTTGGGHANSHAAFGQGTAATAQTLGTDPAARATFGADTSAAAKAKQKPKHNKSTHATR